LEFGTVEFGTVGDGAEVVVDAVVRAGLATPGVGVLHPVITRIGMSERRATSEVRRVVFIFFASTINDVPQRWTFRGSPIRFAGSLALPPRARRHPSELPAEPPRGAAP